MTSPSPRYAFVQVGSFSGINRLLRPELDRALGRSSDVVDLEEPRRFSRHSFLHTPWANVWPTVRQARSAVLRDPRAAVGFRYSTSWLYKHRTGLARTAVSRLQPEFVFQTQTMFDSAVRGVPLYLYTDHTMLANRSYPRVLEDVRRRKSWIARERETYRTAERIFTTSEFARQSLLEDYGCPVEQVVNVGSGTNVAVPDDVPVRDRPVRSILFLGYGWDRKGGPLLVEAFERLREEQPDLTLTVAGCRPRVSTPGVTILGRVPPAEVVALLRETDVFCMPSWVEPSAGVYLEAAAYGLPIAATCVGGTPERVLHERTGLLSAAGDVDGLYENLARLVGDGETARAYGQAGHELVRSEFTWPVVAERIAAEISSRL